MQNSSTKFPVVGLQDFSTDLQDYSTGMQDFNTRSDSLEYQVCRILLGVLQNFSSRFVGLEYQGCRIIVSGFENQVCRILVPARRILLAVCQDFSTGLQEFSTRFESF